MVDVLYLVSELNFSCILGSLGFVVSEIIRQEDFPSGMRLFAQEGTAGLIEIFSMDVGLLEDEAQFQRALRLISEERRKKVLSFQNPMTARLSLGAGVLLALAMERHGLSEKLNQIKQAVHGKPYLGGEGFSFNLSHSGCHAVCACGVQPIGVDIQQVRTELPNHMGRMLSAGEERYLFSLEETQRTAAFYRLWARKESLMKWDGRGLRLPLRELSFVRDGILSDELSFENQKLHVREYADFLPQYAVCVCSRERACAEKIEAILRIP